MSPNASKLIDIMGLSFPGDLLEFKRTLFSRQVKNVCLGRYLCSITVTTFLVYFFQCFYCISLLIIIFNTLQAFMGFHFGKKGGRKGRKEYHPLGSSPAHTPLQ